MKPKFSVARCCCGPVAGLFITSSSSSTRYSPTGAIGWRVPVIGMGRVRGTQIDVFDGSECYRLNAATGELIGSASASFTEFLSSRNDGQLVGFDKFVGQQFERGADNVRLYTFADPAEETWSFDMTSIFSVASCRLVWSIVGEDDTIYVIHRNSGAGTKYSAVTALTSAGAEVWTYEMTDAGTVGDNYSMALDSAGENLWVITDFAADGLRLRRLDAATGAVQAVSDETAGLGEIICDSSNNVYYVSEVDFGAFDSDGTLLWRQQNTGLRSNPFNAKQLAIGTAGGVSVLFSRAAELASPSQVHAIPTDPAAEHAPSVGNGLVLDYDGVALGLDHGTGDVGMV